MGISLQTVSTIKGVLQKTAPALEGRILYSTSTAASRPTMFDAFCKTMQSHAAKESAKKLVAQAELVLPQFEKAAQDMLSRSGANAKVSCRAKSVTSTANKIQKNFRNFKNYNEAREQIQDVILGDGIKNMVGDSLGMRFTLNTPHSDRIYENIIKQRSKNFQINYFEDYFGTGVQPYASNTIKDKFAKLQYIAPDGSKANTIVTSTEKPFGYTRTNINGTFAGINTEIQVGGKYTNRWGDAEHVLYDMRQGKTLDFSHYTKAQIKLAQQIQKAYEKVLINPALNAEYTNNYLNKIWGVLVDAERQCLCKPVFPPLPKGIPDILSAKNILKLA